MDSNSDVQESLRKALARNRMLHDILTDEKQSAHDVFVQERCLCELRRLAALRRWRRRAAAIAAAAAMIMASIGGIWLLADRTITPDAVVTVNMNETPSPPLIPHLATVTNTSGFEIVHHEPTAGLLQIIPTADIRTHMTISSSSTLLADAAGSFSIVSTSDLAMAQSYKEVSSSSLRGNFSERSTESLDTKIAIIGDDELLQLSRVIGIVGFVGNQRVLFRPEKKGSF
jgi:hypothetical protein